jgi:hypothetical protein
VQADSEALMVSVVGGGAIEEKARRVTGEEEL